MNGKEEKSQSQNYIEKKHCKKNHTLCPVAIGTLLNTTYWRKWASGPTLVSLRRLFIRIK